MFKSLLVFFTLTQSRRIQGLQPVARRDCLVAAVAGLVVPSRAFSADGEKLFEVNCAVCHAGGGNVVSRDKTLERTDLDRYGYDREAIEQIIIRGLNAMPGFALDEKRRLSPEDILALVDYVEEQADAGWPVSN
mmetsp:Transcript_22820/g.29569  ORF Transcript_22820/g.29569 Transcript_22820/m.29569 type:complete len:134 (-) Transcript_22820:2104-2505(-)